MTPPGDSSQPRLAAGCRWGTNPNEPAVLFPEGMIRLEGTGQKILELCDGQRTFAEIISALTARYMLADQKRIREDVSKFLEELNSKRIIDY